VFHNREYLVAIRALDDVVALHTLHFADELVEPGTLDVPRAQRAPSQREVKMAGQLVESLHPTFKPAEFSDSYRERVQQLIEAKAPGETPEIKPESPRGQDVDLMGALEASLGQFVDLDDVDPILYDHPYWLLFGGGRQVREVVRGTNP
jgi:DNA end-binding protein Ku